MQYRQIAAAAACNTVLHIKTMIGCLALLGCLNGCTSSAARAAGNSAENLPPEPKVIPIQMGQTIHVPAPSLFHLRTRGIDASVPLFDLYQFAAKPGQTVTIILRSKGGDTALSLLDSYGHDNVQLIESVSSLRFTEVARAARLKGEHSEVIVTLPPDEDGIYYIQPTMAPNGFSLTLQAGSVPSPAPDAAAAPAARFSSW